VTAGEERGVLRGVKDRSSNTNRLLRRRRFLRRPSVLLIAFATVVVFFVINSGCSVALMHRLLCLFLCVHTCCTSITWLSCAAREAYVRLNIILQVELLLNVWHLRAAEAANHL